MPLQDPPPGPGQDLPSTLRYVNSTGGNADLKKHNMLEQLVEQLSDPAHPEVRWEALKRLRVVRLGLEGPTFPAGFLEGFPADYYAFLTDPRLSRIAASIGCTLIAAKPSHLDWDWFGPAGTNWWPGGVTDGRGWQKKVAEGLTHWIEDSFGIDHSTPDPTSWRWASGAPNGGSVWNDLKGQLSPAEQVPAGPAPGSLSIEWRTAKSETAMEVIVKNGGSLQIKTGRPDGGIKLS